MMSAPRGGRPSWAFSSGPRSDGGKPEYHCDKGLFGDERRMRASALEDAAAFGGGAAGEAETQIAQVTQQYVEKWEGHCLSRMRNGSKSLQMHADKKDLSQKQVRSKPEDITPLLTNATAHLNHDEPPGPTIHKAIMLDTKGMISAEDRLAYLEKAIGQVRHAVVVSIVAHEQATLDAQLTKVTVDYVADVKAVKQAGRAVEELVLLMKTITNYRSQGRHNDVRTLTYLRTLIKLGQMKAG